VFEHPTLTVYKSNSYC